MTLLIISIVLLIGLVLSAILPADSLKVQRDQKRTQDIEIIADAINEYIVDNNGLYPTEIKAELTCGVPGNEICATDAASCQGYIDLSELTEYSQYLSVIPKDFGNRNIYGTGYYVHRNAQGGVVVCAPNSETVENLSTSR